MFDDLVKVLEAKAGTINYVANWLKQQEQPLTRDQALVVSANLRRAGMELDSELVVKYLTEGVKYESD